MIDQILIPTYNRSAKLRRVLDWYRREKLRYQIVVLDATDDPDHLDANRRTIESHADFVTHVETPGQDVIPQRLINYLGRVQLDLFAIGNDEDVFLGDFLDAAFAHLRSNPQYVVATGRYITSARPLLGLRRVSYWTDSFLGCDIDEDEPHLRIINFQRLNAGGVPPLYWSVRRCGAFLESCRLALNLRSSSAHELMDQVTSCALGKIWIADRPMLLRDESRVRYVKFANRDVGKLYIGADDLNAIDRLSGERWGPEASTAARAVTSWYRPKASGESYQSRWSSKSYCRFSAVAELGGARTLKCLGAAIRWSCILGVLISQVFAYLYFLTYMYLSGRGARFLRITRAIPVNKVD
jgi:glycosyltransferase domain-containing protein